MHSSDGDGDGISVGSHTCSASASVTYTYHCHFNTQPILCRSVHCLEDAWGHREAIVS